MIAQELDIGFIQHQHFGRQHKHCVIVYLAMGIKSPGKKGMVTKHQYRYEEYFFHKRQAGAKIKEPGIGNAGIGN